MVRTGQSTGKHLLSNGTDWSTYIIMKVPTLRSPIVLVHGLLGFNYFSVGEWKLEYFPGIPKLLQESGNRVYVPFLNPTGGIADRANQLKRYLAINIPNEPVHVFAHSMGGLDTRYMISRLGMEENVLSLTTLGTPHKGSSFADWNDQRFGKVINPLFEFCGINVQAFRDLTTDACKKFNQEIPDAPKVRYFSVAGEYRGTRLEWMLSSSVIEKEEGPNDGLVSVESAKYGESSEIWDGDHMRLVNWENGLWPASSRGRDVKDLYGGLICRLREEGF